MAKHPGGRPIEYSKETLKKAKEYLEFTQDEYIVKNRPKVLIDGTLGEELYVTDNVKIPTIEGLALHLDIARETVYDWGEKYEEFSDILGRLRAKQAEELINKGLSGKYNPTIAKVLLTKHGYREGSELSGIDGGPVKIEGNQITFKDYGESTSGTE